MSTWEELKAQGNEAFRARDFPKAINLYTVALASMAPCPSQGGQAAVLLANRAAAFLNTASYQFARHDAEQVLKLVPNVARYTY